MSAKKRRDAREEEVRGRSPLQDAFHRLLKHRAGTLGGIFIILVILVALFVDTTIPAAIFGGEVKPLIAPKHFAEVSFFERDLPPGTPGYLLGTDYLGRDILSRTLYGTRISLSIAIVAALVSLVIGLTYGIISGFAPTRVDNAMMRFVDFLYGFPLIIFVILLQAYFKAVSRRGATGLVGVMVNIDRALGGMFFLFVALGVLNWIGMARLARAQTLSVKQKEYIESARALGAGNLRIVFRHVLPNILGPCIVSETLAIPGYISTEAFLSFIGLGVTPPTPSWGLMISETYAAIRTYPWESLIPGAALALTTLAFNFLGDGLRDAFDPRLRGT
ncbi:MAG: ABC transporter permease [Candidatus Bipolaricaulis anaerobius]|nr:ABC transporter permease [Candidatus Bipolaricaulis sp.]MDD3747866.1 ABC transporter permease [Candidatus Bipolaricaulis anaerobius]